MKITGTVSSHAQVRRYLRGLAPFEKHQIRHLLACDWCQSSAARTLETWRSTSRATVAELPSPPEDTEADILTGIRYLRLADRRWVEKGVAAATALVALSSRGERRAAAVHHRRYRSHAFAELLLILADELAHQPARSEELAVLASSIAAKLSPSPLTSQDDLRPRALLMVARARRHQGKYRQAEQALRAAGRRFHDRGDIVERSLYLPELAKLRWELGQLEEAAALFEHALGWVVERRRGSFLRGAVHLLAGHVYLALGQVERAAEHDALARFAGKLVRRVGALKSVEQELS